MTRRGQFNLTVIAAFLIAALTPAIFASALSESSQALLAIYIFALIHVLFFGMPAFAILASRQRINMLSCLLGAALAAALPTAFWALLAAPESESSGGIDVVVHHVRTLAGWLEYMQLVGIMAGFGASSGLTFWLVLKLSGSLSAANGNYDPEARADFRAVTIVPAAAIVLVGVVCSVPWLTRDRSCHNIFRDGATSVSPVVSMELDISVSDWPRLRALFARFAAVHGLLLKDESQSQPGRLDALSLDICNDQGTNISANWDVWTGQSPVAGITGTPISIYQVHNDPHWKDIAHDFIAEMNAAWPGKLVFLNRKGNKSAELPAILAPSSPVPPTKPAGK